MTPSRGRAVVPPPVNDARRTLRPAPTIKGARNGKPPILPLRRRIPMPAFQHSPHSVRDGAALGQTEEATDAHDAVRRPAASACNLTLPEVDRTIPGLTCQRMPSGLHWCTSAPADQVVGPRFGYRGSEKSDRLNSFRPYSGPVPALSSTPTAGSRLRKDCRRPRTLSSGTPGVVPGLSLLPLAGRADESPDRCNARNGGRRGPVAAGAGHQDLATGVYGHHSRPHGTGNQSVGSGDAIGGGND